MYIRAWVPSSPAVVPAVDALDERYVLESLRGEVVPAPRRAAVVMGVEAAVHSDAAIEQAEFGAVEQLRRRRAVPALGDVEWTGPEPYIHIHMALSGGPGANEGVLVGHLGDGKLKGAMILQIYEHV